MDRSRHFTSVRVPFSNRVRLLCRQFGSSHSGTQPLESINNRSNLSTNTQSNHGAMNGWFPTEEEHAELQRQIARGRRQDQEERGQREQEEERRRKTKPQPTEEQIKQAAKLEAEMSERHTACKWCTEMKLLLTV